jgi:hypothetical protein
MARVQCLIIWLSPIQPQGNEDYAGFVFSSATYGHVGRILLPRYCFGVAHLYTAPTVLIIDPSSGQLVNDEDRDQWSNAYKIDMAASVEYFEKWALNDSVADPAADSTQLRQLYAEIDRFEQQLAQRVAAGYAVVGPMLEAYKRGNAPEKFDASWNELRDFRMAIPDDIRKLRDEAQRRVSAGQEDIQLQFPEYPLLSWESE